MISIDAISKTLANVCKATSDPLRIMILRVLLHNSFGVLELTELFSTTQSGMSHHLKVLLQAGLVTTRREGNTIFYRRALLVEQQGGEFHQALLNEIDMLEIPALLQQKIIDLYAFRSEISKAFFAKWAENGGLEQQDLIAGVAHYQEPLSTLLDSLPANSNIKALEIGPGDGQFLPVLAKRFQQVLAIDNSLDMLALAEQHCQIKQWKNIQFQHGDATALTLEEPVDCIVANMMLHHLPAPAEAIKSLARNLKPSGSLLLTELCLHEQTWVREACGDLWLGFEPDELNHWAMAAGLQSDESLFIGLRNGFQLQIQRFCVA